MDFVQLRYLKSLANTGSVRLSARRCRVSQAVLKGAISELEAELGRRLIAGDGSRVRLTAFGRLVTAHADPILGSVEAIRRQAAGSKRGLSPDRAAVGRRKFGQRI
jgi:DNA-binding transcriptional LysR family regulator